MTEAEQLSIIEESLAAFPAVVRDDYVGLAFLKLQTVKDRTRDEQVRAIRCHAEYRQKQDRSRALSPVDQADLRAGAAQDMVELRDELERLNPQDRAIVTMIAASNSYAEISDALGLSAATITRRLRRIRERRDAD